MAYSTLLRRLHQMRCCLNSLCRCSASCQMRMPHPMAMSPVVRAARPVIVAGMVAALALAGGGSSWQAASATTRVVSREDPRFDVLVQRRAERLGSASARLEPPAGQPRLSAAQAWSIAGAPRARKGRKPSVRLATFVDPAFGVPTGPGNRLVPVAKRALVWVVVVPDVPAIAVGGPDFMPLGVERPARRQRVCPTYAPIDAMTGQSLGWWQDC
jgi:hypothetical protein